MNPIIGHQNVTVGSDGHTNSMPIEPRLSQSHTARSSRQLSAVTVLFFLLWPVAI